MVFTNFFNKVYCKSAEKKDHEFFFPNYKRPQMQAGKIPV